MHWNGVNRTGSRTGAWESAVSISAAPHMSRRNPLIQSWLNAYARITCARRQGRGNPKGNRRRDLERLESGDGRREGEGANLELEGEGREDEGALLLEHLADVVAGGAGQRQRHRFPHLADADLMSCAVRLRAGIGRLPSFPLNFFFGGGHEGARGEGEVVAESCKPALFSVARPCSCAAMVVSSPA
jgi:hypothetical protein